MVITPEISLGSLLTILAVIAGGIGFLWAMRSRLDVGDVKMDVMRKDIADVKAEINDVKQVLNMQVRNDMRLQQNEKMIDELRGTVELLRRGEGMILPLDYADRLERAEAAARAALSAVRDRGAGA